MRGDVGLGEGYMDGSWDTSDLDALMQFALANTEALRLFSSGNVFFRLLHSASCLERQFAPAQPPERPP